MRKPSSRISRRKFLINGAIAAVAAVTAKVQKSLAASSKKKKSAPVKPEAQPKEEPTVTLSTLDLNMTVNGKKIRLTVPAGKTLAEVLRQDLGLTGVKIGCNSSECGTCTVLVNSRPMYSCNLLAVLANNAFVETVEGLSAGESLHPIQQAFIEKDALQCGFCTPGMICASKALFIRNRNPQEEDMRAALAGNICRCGAYEKILEALQMVAKS